MNKTLEKFARNSLKEMLSHMTDSQQLLFKRMYANGKLDKEINKIVDDMPAEKLDWAMTQCENTINKEKQNG